MRWLPMPLGGKKLQPFEVAELAYRHGLPLDNLALAVAICAGESSFHDGAWNFNDKSGDKSYGLWQINMIEPYGEERRRKWSLGSNDELFDADRNAQIMAEMSKNGSDWSPWGAFRNGSYERHMVIARRAVDSLRERFCPGGED